MFQVISDKEDEVRDPVKTSQRRRKLRPSKKKKVKISYPDVTPTDEPEETVVSKSDSTASTQINESVILRRQSSEDDNDNNQPCTSLHLEEVTEDIDFDSIIEKKVEDLKDPDSDVEEKDVLTSPVVSRRSSVDSQSQEYNVLSKQATPVGSVSVAQVPLAALRDNSDDFIITFDGKSVTFEGSSKGAITCANSQIAKCNDILYVRVNIVSE